MSARPLLCFVGMFKDEASNIRATLESVKPHVDCWSIVDTGSADETPAIIAEVMAGVPGQLHTESFVDYATTRNRALVLAETVIDAEFTLMLSGDETLDGGGALREFLETRRGAQAGAYCVEMRQGSASWPYTRVLRMGGGWRYVGAVHERPVGPDGETEAESIAGVVVTHAPTDPERKLRRLREYDLPVLSKIVEDESHTLEERAHAIFFLAETHANLAGMVPREADGNPVSGGPYRTHAMTAMSLYWRYAEIAQKPEHPAYDPNKVYYALVMFYQLAGLIGFYTPEEMVSRMEPIVAVAPQLPEARFLLASNAIYVDAKKGLFLALEAARTAAEARARPTNERSELSIGWKSFVLAARCAKKLGRGEQTKKLVDDAVAAGGPREIVERLIALDV